MTKQNQPNKSGKKYEIEVREALEEIKYSYRRTKECDFELITAEGKVGLEAKGQQTDGTTDEKLMYGVFKYADKYKKLIFLLHQNFKVRDEKILHSMYEAAKIYGCKLTILFGTNELKKYLNELPMSNGIFAFCDEEK